MAISIFFRQINDGFDYPKIEAHHLGLDNIRSFHFNQFPPSCWEDHWSPFRQSAVLYLTESTPETFTAAIRHLETLCFIKLVSPGNTVYLDIIE